MFERLKRLFSDGRITETGLRKAVVSGLISEYEFEAITGNLYLREAAMPEDQAESQEQ